jgi:hypothetical protein
MCKRLILIIVCSTALLSSSFAKDKNKSSLPDAVLQAQTVRVVVSPDAGLSINQPTANANARDRVENALQAWGRFKIVYEGDSDLVIAVRASNGQAASPTIENGSTDTHISGVQYGKVTVGTSQGHGPAMSEPTVNSKSTGPHVGKQIDGGRDLFAVYQGGPMYKMSAPPLWKCERKNALKAPDMVAIREFRKAVDTAESQTKKP